MSVRTMRVAAVVLLTAVLIGAWMLWLRVEPGVRPDDIALHGRLVPVSALPEGKPQNGETWATEIQVKRSAVSAEAQSGTDIVYFYVPGFDGGSYELVGAERQELLRQTTSDTMYKQVAGMLKQIGLSVGESELNDSGFTYAGTQPAYTARVYLKTRKSAPSAAPDGMSYAIYIHQERKWGRNVSWTKAIKLEKA